MKMRYHIFPRRKPQPASALQQQQGHAEACSECRDELASWRQALRACWEDQQFDEMILAALAGDTGIKRKELSAGLALFKPATRDSPGLLLVVDPDDWMDIRAVHKGSDDTAFDVMR